MKMLADANKGKKNASKALPRSKER